MRRPQSLACMKHATLLASCGADPVVPGLPSGRQTRPWQGSCERRLRLPGTTLATAGIVRVAFRRPSPEQGSCAWCFGSLGARALCLVE